MSYSIEKMRAVSLQAVDGAWCMDVEELVRINRNTFRPRRRRVAGRDAILQHLATCQRGLVTPTQHILDGEDPADCNFRYEARGGTWVQAPELSPVPRAQKDDASVNESETLMELVRLAQRVDEMSVRIRTLSEEVASLRAAQGAPKVVEAQSAERGASGTDELREGGQQGLTASTSTVGASSRSGSLEADALSLPPAHDADVGAAPVAREPEPTFAVLKVPSTEAILDLIQGLIDNTVKISKADPAAWNMASEAGGYVAMLSADDGSIRGALAMDLQATIRLAGGMLMESKEELDAQIEDRTPSDDILDAAGEVLNTLTAAVNKTSGNAHVRCGALEPIGSEAQAWIRNSRNREDFSLSLGGRLAVLCR